MSPRYQVPSRRVQTEYEVKRSRFIATIDFAPEEADAKGLIEEVRQSFPDASHNCWAYLVGAPGSKGSVGRSDDGEPYGTAGRPMLNVLVHSCVGDVAVVVTRYFGGTKLGKGGLVKAYSEGVQRALDAVVLKERVNLVAMRLIIGYAKAASVQQVLPAYEATLIEESYTTEVALTVQLPDERVEVFVRAIGDLTNGQVRVVQPCRDV